MVIKVSDIFQCGCAKNHMKMLHGLGFLTSSAATSHTNAVIVNVDAPRARLLCTYLVVECIESGRGRAA